MVMSIAESSGFINIILNIERKLKHKAELPTIKKYGVIEEENKHEKKEKEAQLIKTMESVPDRSGRRKTLEQFVKVP